MKFLQYLFEGALVGTMTLALWSSCNSTRTEQSNKDSLSMHADHMTDSVNQQIADFKASWKQKMNQLDDQIDQWEDKVEQYSDEKKAQAQVKLDSLKAQRKRLGDQINQASEKAGEQWDSFKANVSAGFDSLETKITDAFDPDK